MKTVVNIDITTLTRKSPVKYEGSTPSPFSNPGTVSPEVPSVKIIICPGTVLSRICEVAPVNKR